MQKRTAGPVRRPFLKREWPHAAFQNESASALFGRLVTPRVSLWSQDQEEHRTSRESSGLRPIAFATANLLRPAQRSPYPWSPLPLDVAQWTFGSVRRSLPG